METHKEHKRPSKALEVNITCLYVEGDSMYGSLGRYLHRHKAGTVIEEVEEKE